MGREARRKREPNLPTVQSVDVPEKVPAGRKILFALAILIAIAAFTYGISSLIKPASGWEEIQFSGAEANCARDFNLIYETGRSGIASVAERKVLISLLTEVMTTGYRVFSLTEDFEDTVSIHQINMHPNEELTVDPMLYTALKTLCAEDARTVYLGPVYEQYRSVFYSDSEEEALEYDPVRNPEVAEYVREVLPWCLDPETIELAFPAENVVCLKVSDDYLAFAKEYAITNLIDAFVYADAFITDAMADRMIAAGVVHGCVSSATGFVRNTDGPEQKYTLVLSDGLGKSVEACYTGGASVVMLGDHALASEGTPWYYYAADGTVRVPYLNPINGECTAPVHLLSGIAAGSSCGEILTKLLPVWFSGKVDQTDLLDMEKEGLSGVIWDGDALISNGMGLSVIGDQD